MATGGNVSGRKTREGADGSDFVFDALCSLCLKKNRQKEAKKYCTQCQDLLCSKHIKTHSRFSSMSGHVLVDKDDIAFESSTSERKFPSIPTERCARHKTKVVDMFCETHDIVGCLTCIVLEHKQCEVLSIPDSIDKLYNTRYIKHVTAELTKTIEELRSTMKAGKTGLDKLEDINTAAVKAVSEFKKEIISNVNDLERQTLASLRQMVDEAKAVLAKQNNDVQENMDRANKIAVKLDKSEGDISQQYVCTKLADDLTRSCKELCQSLKGSPVEELTFERNNGISQTLRSHDSLGKIQVHRKARELQVGKRKRFNVVSNHDDAGTDITGLCIISEDAILLADNKNSAVKLLKLSTQEMKTLELADEPWSVCTIKQSEAAVTCPNSKKVQLLSVCEEMKLKKTLDVKHTCSGIAHYNGVLYLHDGSSTIFVYDLSGKRLEKFSFKGSELFMDMCGMCFNDCGSAIYIADGIKGLTAVDAKTGEVLWIFSEDGGLKGACGVCIDGRGSVFVCGRDSHNVMQLDENGQKVKEILDKSHGIRYPWAICFDDASLRIYMIQTDSENGWMFDVLY